MADYLDFADFVLATGQAQLSTPDQILSDAVKQVYGHPCLNASLKGSEVEQVVRGGDLIKEQVQHSAGTQASFYNPNDQFNYVNDQTMKDLTYKWCFLRTSWGYVDQEVKLNTGESQRVLYKRIAKAKRQAAYIAKLNAMEEQWWGDPSNADQEARTSTTPKPLSIRSLITQDGIIANATAITTAGGDGAPAAWGATGTIGGQNPTTNTVWRNPTQTYDHTAIDSTLLDAKGSMYRKLMFKAPRTSREFFEETAWQKNKIFTSDEGVKTYERIARESNDRFTPGTDGGWVVDGSIYKGVAVQYIKELDTIGSAGTGWTAGKPQYIFVNFNHIFAVISSSKFMQEEPPVNLAPVGRPESWVVNCLSWYAIACNSRKRGGGLVRTAA